MGSAFKDIIRNDNVSVFLNPNEFGEIHLVGGRRMNVIVDDNEMIEREKRQSGMKDYRQGVYKRQMLFYACATSFGPLPPVGRSLSFDNQPYVITDAVEEDGIYSISLEAMRS